MSDRDLLGREIEGLSKNRPARLYFLQWLQILSELAFEFLIFVQRFPALFVTPNVAL